MLRSGDVFKFRVEKQKFMLLGLNFYTDLDLEEVLGIIKQVQRFYSELKDRDTLLFYGIFFRSVFDFLSYEVFNSEKPITDVIHISGQHMLTRGVNVLIHEDIKLYLLKNAFVNVNVTKYIDFDIVEIFNRKKEQLAPYIQDL